MQHNAEQKYHYKHKRKAAYSRCCTETVTMLPRNWSILWALYARSMGNKRPTHGLSMPSTWSLSAHLTGINRPTNGLISKRYQHVVSYIQFTTLRNFS